MSKEKKFLKIDIEIYKYSIILTWETTAKEIKKYLEKNIKLKEKWEEEYQKDIEFCSGLTTTIEDNGQDIIIWLKKKPKMIRQYGVLYHELFHATEYICEDVGITGTEIPAMEAKAYLFEYLTNTCNIHFRK